MKKTPPTTAPQPSAKSHPSSKPSPSLKGPPLSKPSPSATTPPAAKGTAHSKTQPASQQPAAQQSVPKHSEEQKSSWSPVSKASRGQAANAKLSPSRMSAPKQENASTVSQQASQNEKRTWAFIVSAPSEKPIARKAKGSPSPEKSPGEDQLTSHSRNPESVMKEQQEVDSR